MTESKDEDVMLATRVSPEVREKFGVCADKFNMSSAALLRELVYGMVEDRVAIAPPKNVLYSINTNQE